MDDIMQKLSELVSSEEGMNTIKSFADMLTAGNTSAPQSNSSPDLSSVTSMLSGLLGNNSPPKQEQAPADFDITKIMPIINAFSSTKVDDKTANLLRALRPLLSPERQPRVDEALKILRLLAVWPIIKENGLSFLGL